MVKKKMVSVGRRALRVRVRGYAFGLQGGGGLGGVGGGGEKYLVFMPQGPFKGKKLGRVGISNTSYSLKESKGGSWFDEQERRIE